jgi:acyl carrier protein
MTKRTWPLDPFDIVAQALGCSRESITIDSAMYRDHGWDSFGHVGIILALEDAYNITIDDTDIRLYATMRAIVALHERSAPKPRSSC